MLKFAMVLLFAVGCSGMVPYTMEKTVDLGVNVSARWPESGGAVVHHVDVYNPFDYPMWIHVRCPGAVFDESDEKWFLVPAGGRALGLVTVPRRFGDQELCRVVEHKRF